MAFSGKTSPANDPCHYGLTRERCTLGCGIACRPSRRAIAMGHLLVAHEYGKMFTASPSVAAEHPGCGTDACCGSCASAVR